ncbi:MAG TPA: helix-turn-helix transcriptional regulator [Atopostipes sp.]|nr:helix-turn-helix transcriptional regulator [Atopostipes sp.]
MTFGDQLSKARKEKEFTQEELAEKLNLSRQTILRWEKNQVFPDISNLKAVAQVLDVSFDYLLGEDKTNKVPSSKLSLTDVLVGKEVRLIIYEESLDNYLAIYDNNCLVLDIAEDMVQVQYTEKNGLQMKIIPLSVIQSFTLVNERGE